MTARAKLFTHGGSQAVRLPKAFRFDGSEVSVRREGSRVILEPLPPGPPRTAAEVEAMFAEMDALGPSSLEYPPEPPPDVDDWRL
jgi:antitoxin VapB